MIDDDGDFWADGVTTLIRRGHDVLTARTRREAQSLCEVSSTPLHLVILDISFEPHRWIEGLDPRHYGTTLVAMIRVIVLTTPHPQPGRSAGKGWDRPCGSFRGSPTHAARASC